MIKLLLFFLSFFLKSQIVDDVVISTQSISERKIYKPSNLRNPMVRPLNFYPTTLNYKYSKSTSTQSDVFNIDNIVLNGIMSTTNFKEALLRDVVNGNMYIVRYGKIYMLNRKQVEGYTAEILGKGVIIYDKKNNKRVELIISNEGDGL